MNYKNLEYYKIIIDKEISTIYHKGPRLLKDPINKADEIVNEASEIFKRLPDLPIIMDKANDVVTLIAEGKFNPNTLAYHSLREEELKL